MKALTPALVDTRTNSSATTRFLAVTGAMARTTPQISNTGACHRATCQRR
ncbi:MAG: hypothetical protein HN350_14135, partial [Phycisphaerales bacterium]|nr:hypothetical protein [Phycisphaerales bacterium]